MKILMLTPYLPYPPASGGQIRTLNLLKYLSKNNEITLVSLYKNDKEKQYASYLQAFCKKIYVCKRAEKPWQLKNILKSVLSFLPFLIVRNYSTEARQTVEKLLATEEFDVIHAETFYIMPHIPETKLPILLVEQTIEYKVYKHFLSTLPFPIRFVLSLDINKLKYWEKFYWKRASLVAAVSQADKEAINAVEPTVNPVIIPNGAGDEMFIEKLPQKDLKKPTLLFMGNFSWLQNVEAANYLIEKVFPQLMKKIPTIKLIIAGQNTRKKIPSDLQHNIEVINIQPDDSESVKRLYQENTLFIAPIYGPGGTRLKILASMAAGLPVVSTQTGITGLGMEPGKDSLVAESSQEFVDQTLKLLDNEKLYYDIQRNAYELAKKDYSWNAISAKLEKVYKQIIANT